MKEFEAKLACHQVAAVLTAGVISNLPDTFPLDAEIKLDETRAENLQAWQLHKIFYHGVVGALAGDAASWPAPKLPADAALPDVAGVRFDGSAITALVSGLVQLGAPAVGQALTPVAVEALRKLVAQIPAAAAPPATSPALPT